MYGYRITVISIFRPDWLITKLYAVLLYFKLNEIVSKRDRMSWSIDWHSCFIFGSSQVKILAWRPAILIEAFCGFPRSLQASISMYLDLYLSIYIDISGAFISRYIDIIVSIELCRYIVINRSTSIWIDQDIDINIKEINWAIFI
jgi:hypothetical protein